MEPDGKWDAASIEALKQFQKDQNLAPDGKLNSLSLIALGLGPQRGGTRLPGPPQPKADIPAAEPPPAPVEELNPTSAPEQPNQPAAPSGGRAPD
jgi:hypothetical protein